MLVLAFGSGNHSNRLFQNIHFEAFCKERNIEYINPSFFDMHKYYMEPCKLIKGIKGLLFLNDFSIKILKKIKKIKIISFDNELQNNEILLIPPPPQHTPP
jgi:hypothetical protein